MKLFFYICLTLFSTLCLAQNIDRVDSLKNTGEDEDTAIPQRTAAYCELTEIFYDQNLSKANSFCRKAAELIEDSASLPMAEVYVAQALMSFASAEYNKAIEELISADKIASEFRDIPLRILSALRLAHCYGIKGYLNKALAYNIKAAKLSELLDKDEDRTRLHLCTGKTYIELQQFAKAEESFNKISSYFRKEGNKVLRANLYIDEGRIATEYEQWTTAEDYINAGLEFSAKLNSVRGQAYANFALADLFRMQGKDKEALEYYKKAEKKYRALDAPSDIAFCYKGLAELEMKRNNFKIAGKYLRQALDFARETRSMLLKQKLCKAFSEYYALSDDFEQAMRYYRKYSVIKDSIFSFDRIREIKEIEAKHEMGELTKEKEELALERDLTNTQLEIEQLKNNQNSYIIIGLLSSLLLMVIIGLLVFRQDKLKTQIRETELEQRALRSQMNPHFMFNSLNSIQGLIATGNNAEANIYLAKFSRLMRRILQNSRQAYIPLRKEIEFLDNYIELEQMRFKEAFVYTLDEEKIEDAHFVMIPPLVIQPFIENAIIHGLLRKPEKGSLVVTFEDYNNSLLKCTVTDNGIGRKAAALFKTDESQESLGIKITEQRLKYLTIKEKINEPFINVIDLLDEKGNGIGTKVELLLPIKYKV